jgi:hypothetical protein
MTKGAKIGIIAVVVIGLAVGGYFLYKKFASDGTDSNDTSTDEQEPQGTPAPTPNVSDSSLEPTPFKNQAQGDYFRLWVNRFYPTDAKKLDLSKTGAIDNSFIRKAWAKFGVLYKQQVANWNKIKNIPSAFAEKFEKKDSYNFKIFSDGKLALIPKRTYPNSEGFEVVYYSDGTWKLQAKTDSKQKMASGKWWDGGKQANFDFPTSIKKNVKASNFFDLAKILSDSTEKSSFSGMRYRQSLDLENNFID